MIPAKREVIKIESFASAICCGLSKDKIAMNMDIVKPIPANKPTPAICHQLLPSGKALSFKRVQIKDVIKIPIGFPSNSPKVIPSPNEEVNPPIISDSKVILVLAKANMGIMIKLTGFVKACSKRSNGDSIAVSFVGMVIATNTPAIVA